MTTIKITNGGHTATDTATGLMWRRGLIGQKWNGKDYVGEPIRFDFIEAKKFASRNRRFAGYNDWRLPTTEEVKTLSGSGFKINGINRIYPIPLVALPEYKQDEFAITFDCNFEMWNSSQFNNCDLLLVRGRAKTKRKPARTGLGWLFRIAITLAIALVIAAWAMGGAK